MQCQSRNHRNQFVHNKTPSQKGFRESRVYNAPSHLLRRLLTLPALQSRTNTIARPSSLEMLGPRASASARRPHRMGKLSVVSRDNRCRTIEARPATSSGRRAPVRQILCKTFGEGCIVLAFPGSDGFGVVLARCCEKVDAAVRFVGVGIIVIAFIFVFPMLVFVESMSRKDRTDL